MSTITDELFETAERLEKVKPKGDLPEIAEPLQCIESAATKIGKAWSGLWLGYNSCVYYEGLQPPPNAHFSQEWGLLLGQIHFPKGNIRVAFEEVSRYSNVRDESSLEDVARSSHYRRLKFLSL